MVLCVWHGLGGVKSFARDKAIMNGNGQPKIPKPLTQTIISRSVNEFGSRLPSTRRNGEDLELEKQWSQMFAAFHLQF